MNALLLSILKIVVCLHTVECTQYTGIIGPHLKLIISLIYCTLFLTLVIMASKDFERISNIVKKRAEEFSNSSSTDRKKNVPVPGMT